jgi:hypothetical protein
MLEIVEPIQLILPDRRLIGPPVWDVEGLVDRIGSEPFLRGLRDSGVSRCNATVCTVELRVGKPCPRDTNRRPTALATDRVVHSGTTEAQRGAFLADVPTNTGEEFDATTEAEKAHEMRWLG